MAPEFDEPIPIEPFEVGERGRAQGLLVASDASQGRQALGGVELRPRPAGLVGDAEAPGATSILTAENPRRSCVQACERPPEPELGRVVRCAALDPGQHEVGGPFVVAIGCREDLRHRKLVGLSQPAQARSFGGEEAGRRVRVGLGEDPSAGREVDPQGRGRVAAVDGSAGDHLVAEAGADGLPQRSHVADATTPPRRGRGTWCR